MRMPLRFAPLALAVALAACSTLPERDAALENARAAHEAARADANVQTYAAAEYQRADETYRAAEAAWKDYDSHERVDHLAYLAQRRAEQAIETGRLKAAEARVASGQRRARPRAPRGAGTQCRGGAAAGADRQPAGRGQPRAGGRGAAPGVYRAAAGQCERGDGRGLPAAGGDRRTRRRATCRRNSPTCRPATPTTAW